MISRIGFSFLLVILSTAFLSCSKKSAPASISLQFAQKNQSLSSQSPIRHLVVNVSAPDMRLISQEFDCRKQDCRNVNIEVPSGSNRLLQILMVYDTSTMTQILYGDVTQSLSGGENSVEVSLKEIGNFVAEGEVMGRYVPSSSHSLAGKFLTGVVNVWGRVGTGKPNMRITRTEIFGGWFNTFVLDNLGLYFTFSGFDRQGNSYQNVPILNDLHDSSGLTLNSTGLQGELRKVARYSSTLTVFNDGPDGNQERPFETHIVGLFGANPNNRILCSESLNSSFSFSGGTDRSRLCRDSTCSTYFTWGDIQVQGSVNGTDSICTNTNSELKVSLPFMGQRQNLLDFSGPLLGTHDIPSVKFNEITSTLTWRLNPTAFLPAGLEIFVVDKLTDESWDRIYSDNHDGYNCGILLNEGFQSLGTFSQSGSIDLSSYSSVARPTIALCPKRRIGGYYASATFINAYGGSYSEPLATQLRMSKPLSLLQTTQLNANVCHPLIIEPVDGSYRSASLPGPIDIVLSTDDATASFFEDSECTSAVTSFLNFHSNRQTVYYKSTKSTGSFTLNAEDSTSQLSSAVLTLDSVAQGTLATVKMIPAFYRKNSPFEMANTEVCVPFQLATFDNNNNLGAFAATIQFNPPAGSDIYSTSEVCEGGGTALLKATDEALTGPIKKYWLGRSSADTLITNILSSCVDAGVTCQNEDLEIINPGPFHHFHVDILNGSSFTYMDCIHLKIGAYDNSWPHSYPVQFGDAPALPTFEVTDINTSTNNPFGGTFYNEQSTAPTCTTAGTGSIAPSAGDTKVFFQYFPGTPGSLELTIDVGTEFLQSLYLTIN